MFGVFIGRRYKWVKIFHIAGIGFALTIQIVGWYCPLTHLEIWLREKHMPSQTYGGSFIIHYVEKLVYINLSSEIILIATILLILATAWIYLHRRKNSTRF